MHRNLVIVRAGDSSLHPTWMDSHQRRTWDCVVSYFGDDPGQYRSPNETRIDGKGPKWKGLHRLLTSHPELLDRYDYIWLPDDDIAATPESIEILFSAMHRYDLQLAQPALSPQSYYSWCVTLHNPATAIRWTNFVEVMVPCFRASFLKEVLLHFSDYISGSGFDWVWPKLAGKPGLHTAIIDRAIVTHTRPFGGPNYRFFGDLRYGAEDEIGYVMRQFGIPDATTRIYSFVPRWGGPRLSAATAVGRSILRAGMRALVAGAYVRRAPYRWELDKFMSPYLAAPDVILHPYAIPDGTRFAEARSASETSPKAREAYLAQPPSSSPS